MQPIPLRPAPVPGGTDLKLGLGGLQAGKPGKSEEKLTPEEEQEAKRLSALQRSRRRFRRNAVIWSLCVIILFVVMYFMAR
jgi:predicted nucleic acid-binding Zn ribbon protein